MGRNGGFWVVRRVFLQSRVARGLGRAVVQPLPMAKPDIKIVVTDHGGLTSNVGVYAQAAGLTPGQVYFAGFDMSPNTAQAVKGTVGGD